MQTHEDEIVRHGQPLRPCEKNARKLDAQSRTQTIEIMVAALKHNTYEFAVSSTMQVSRTK